jgi:hypothetical protein
MSVEEKRKQHPLLLLTPRVITLYIDTYVCCVHPKLVYIFFLWWLNHSSLFSGNITPGQILYGV